jgi:hypothetical protein
MIYLASPYSSKNPELAELRFRQVCEVAAVLMGQGVLVFSPIAHCHPIAMAGKLPTDFEYWYAYDKQMIAMCDELYVLRLDGWQHSRGISAEIQLAESMGKTVTHLDYCNGNLFYRYLPQEAADDQP